MTADAGANHPQLAVKLLIGICFFGPIPIFVWRKDAEGRFTFANKGFLDAFGTTAEKLIGENDYELFPPALAEKYRRDEARVFKTGRTLRLIEEQAAPEGTRMAEVIKIPIHDPRGETVRTQGIFWDMTAWKKAQEQSRTEQDSP